MVKRICAVCGKKRVKGYYNKFYKAFICEKCAEEQETKPYGRCCEFCGADLFTEAHKKGCKADPARILKEAERKGKEESSVVKRVLRHR